MWLQILDIILSLPFIHIPPNHSPSPSLPLTRFASLTVSLPLMHVLLQLMGLREVEEEERSFQEDSSSMDLLLLFQRLLLALIYTRASTEKDKGEGG